MNVKPLTKSYIESSVTVTEEGCWKWNKTLTAKGYGLLVRNKKALLAHRVSYFLWNGEWPNVCRHKCDNRWCCNPEHLEDGTHADNVRDRDERGRGRWVTREAHGRAKLNEEKIREIHELRAKGWTQQRIADKLGVHQTNISAVLRGVTWITR